MPKYNLIKNTLVIFTNYRKKVDKQEFKSFLSHLTFPTVIPVTIRI